VEREKGENPSYTRNQRRQKAMEKKSVVVIWNLRENILRRVGDCARASLSTASYLPCPLYISTSSEDAGQC